MTILAIDTAAQFCAVCIWDDVKHQPLSKHVVDLGRGHAECLLPAIESALNKSKRLITDITKVAVSVGPGSFTGIRVGVAAARGLGLALDVPVVGVSTFHALAAEAIEARDINGDFAVAIGGGRGQAFVQLFSDQATETAAPFIVKLDEDAKAQIDSSIDLIVGNAAQDIDPARACDQLNDATTCIERYAALGETSTLAPKPLYVRAADAKIQEGFALPRRGADAG